MTDLEQLEEALEYEDAELKKIDKTRHAKWLIVRRIRDKIMKIQTDDILGDGPFAIENIMKLEWSNIPTKVHTDVTAWFYENLKYLHQSGYHPDSGGQPAFIIKMDRGKDVEEQIEEISYIVELTNWYPENCQYFKLSSSSRDPKKDCKFKPFSLFVSAKVYDYDDDHNSYSLRVFEDGSVAIARNAWREHTYSSLDEALRYIHKYMWYQDS